MKYELRQRRKEILRSARVVRKKNRRTSPAKRRKKQTKKKNTNIPGNAMNVNGPGAKGLPQFV